MAESLRIGFGGYANARKTSLDATGCRSALIMPLEWSQEIADAVVGDPTYTTILRGDGGNDGDQYDENRPPEDEARAYFDRFLRPRIERWPKWSAALGPCEWWHRLDGDQPQPHLEYRAAFESRLCHIVQLEYQIAYLWGSIPIGNLEAADIRLFADVIGKAYGWAAHLYLGPNRKTLAEETDDWYLNRPLRIWLPECRRLGLPFKRLCATEIGTYHPPAETGLTMGEYAALCVQIARKLQADCAAAGVELLGAFPFGFGTVGRMTVCKMVGTEATIRAANPERVAISLSNTGSDPMPTTIPNPAKDQIGEYARWAMARISKAEDPRDVSAFVAHLRNLGADYRSPEAYGLPTVKVLVPLA